MPPNHIQRAAEAMARAAWDEYCERDGRDTWDWLAERPTPTASQCSNMQDTRAEQLAALHALLAILPEIGWRLVPATLSLEKDVRPLERVVIDQVYAEKGELYLEDCGIDTIYRDLLSAAPTFNAESGHGG